MKLVESFIIAIGMTVGICKLWVILPELIAVSPGFAVAGSVAVIVLGLILVVFSAISAQEDAYWKGFYAAKGNLEKILAGKK